MTDKEIHAYKRKLRIAANPEKYKAYAIAWQKANPDKCREASRRYYAKNKHKWVAKVREWQKANPESVRASVRKWQAANPEKLKAYRRAYYIRRKAARLALSTHA